MPLLKVDDEDVRSRLRKPLGKLFKSFSQALSEARKLRLKGSLIISIGDRTTINFLSNGFIPDLAVVDGRELRRKITPIKAEFFKKIYRVKNPPGCINTEAEKIFKHFKESKPALLIVDGEEDLLTLLASISINEYSSIFYGQPRRGVVLIELTNKSRRKLLKIYEEIVKLNMG